MEFLKGICPYCKGELQLPMDRETVICMYCGKELEVKAALIQQEPSARPKPVDEKVAIEALQGLMFGIENPIQYFKKALYMDFYKKYLYENAKNLSILDQAYLSLEEPDSMMDQIAEAFVGKIDDELKGLRGRKKEELQMDYNMSMVVYVFPALLETNSQSGQAWIDVLITVWKRHFPKTDLKAASAKEINAGFKYRFCYITTAVCENLNKPDDCYELSLLRSFRDDYLLKQPGGEAMVHEYYDIAPTIVKHIGRRSDADDVYRDIWQQYLSPCIHLIESDQKQACVDLYKDMVYELKDRYFH